jgi:2-polyprenyl-3-methyl-5-hydroxy-6-metoxy-1,4-benzoquinol methylase
MATAEFDVSFREHEPTNKMKCRICGNLSGNREYVAKEMMFGLRDSFVYFQCAECGCLQIAEFPTDMTRYYPASYYSLQQLTAPGVRSSGVRHWARVRANEFAVVQRGLLGRVLHRLSPNEDLRKAVTQHFPGGGVSLAKLRTSSRILDVGCGSGTFLLALSEAGFRQLQGVDLYVEASIEYPGGVRILKGSLEACEGKWDVVMFHHSFEHLENPLETLKTAAGLLVGEGTIVVRIPIVSSHAWEKYGIAWVQLDAPRHFFLHSRESISRLAKAVGLQVVRVEYDSTEFQFLGSELYLRDIPLCPRGSSSPDWSVFTPDEIQKFRQLAVELNASRRGDQAAFYLQKA